MAAIALRYPSSLASHAAKKFPASDTPITRKNARLTSRSLLALSQLATSGRFLMCCKFQNMNAHHAVSEQAQTTIVKIVILRTSPLNKSATPGIRPCEDRALVHSCGSGTDCRIQYTINAGKIPTRNTYLYGFP